MNKTWWKESVVYQIYPRSFCDSNGDGIGDLKGIQSKLDYLKELGINVIWMSPVYKSPNDDNGYDISDYQDIMTEFGTMADFDELLAAAHERGIRIVMDLVVNHTSDEHPWFIESRSSKENPKRDYYIWREPVDGHEPNNWGSAFSGSAWEWDEKTQMYYLHCFSKKQPDLNWENPKVRDDVFAMMDWWCQKGIDGFRMDVISMISKKEGLPDVPTDGGLYGNCMYGTCNGPHVHEYLQEMNQKVLSKYDLMTVGECAGVTIEEAKKYANAEGTELNMVFQFEHTSLDSGTMDKWCKKPIPLKELKENLSKWETELEGKAWNSLYFCNHDQPRIVSRLGDDSPLSAKCIATVLHMMQGTPYVYQGEELGMTNCPFGSIENYRDLESINAYHELTEAGLRQPEELLECIAYKSRDNARTPMQWNSGKNGGFTEGTPWIMVNPNYKEINAEQELADPDSVFHYYQQLIALRRSSIWSDIIVYGHYELLAPEDPQVFAYTREYEGRKLLVICNLSAEKVSFEIPGSVSWTQADRLIGNYEKQELSIKTELRPWEAEVWSIL
ncbi:MAG TPA: alpha-glucosidase [Candidatus Blautia stercoripullorum]|uniref:Alpha-glucosidase n=1 Tax=Candidatus Blautia stercoripullorum TaxID=2838502 RepID=A0A9D2R618_9FIRM|nr:alpha-glucosidase [Candidatus Blautia stercoripullorum]